MKRFLLLLSALLCLAQAHAQRFTENEQHNVRVSTPGLYDKEGKHYICDAIMVRDGYCFPLKNAKVISDYGRRDGRGHAGIDLKTFPRDTIRAAFAGIVRMSTPFSGYGKVVVIRHSSGFETLYSHNVQNLVKSGDYVQAGQPIALTGRTGRATTEHLHFEIRIDGIAVNPHAFIDFATYAVRPGCWVCERKGNEMKITVINK